MLKTSITGRGLSTTPTGWIQTLREALWCGPGLIVVHITAFAPDQGESIQAHRQPAGRRTRSADPAATRRFPLPRLAEVRSRLCRRRRARSRRLHGRQPGSLGRRGVSGRGEQARLEGKAELVSRRHRGPHDPGRRPAHDGQARRRDNRRRRQAAMPSAFPSPQPSPRSSRTRPTASIDLIAGETNPAPERSAVRGLRARSTAKIAEYRLQMGTGADGTFTAFLACGHPEGKTPVPAKLSATSSVHYPRLSSLSQQDQGAFPIQ